jgi:hypothetical protein
MATVCNLLSTRKMFEADCLQDFAEDDPSDDVWVPKARKGVKTAVPTSAPDDVERVAKRRRMSEQ